MSACNMILDRLKNAGFERYIVGGYIRDMLLGIVSHDVDITTNARPDDIKTIFSDRSIKNVGEAFKVMIVDGIEVATYRKDHYSGLSNKNVNIEYADTIDEDLSRRDFTINSMALNPDNNEIIDLFNGRNDIENKIIRFTGDSESRILEDPNRIIRACRFLAKINGEFDILTGDAIRSNRHLVIHIKKERIKEEIMKSMKIPLASVFFESLMELDLLSKIFPSLNSCAGMYHGKHHAEDVFVHNMICGNNISIKYPVLKLMGYLHDVGKSVSYQDTLEGRTFLRHEEVGSDILKKELKLLKFPNEDIEFISNMTLVHMRGLKHSSPKAIRRLLKYMDELKLNYKDLLRFKIADRKANLSKNCYSISDIKGFIKKFTRELNRDDVERFYKLKINGDDIINTLNIEQGPLVGSIKTKLENIVLDDPEYNTREYLLGLLEEYRKH